MHRTPPSPAERRADRRHALSGFGRLVSMTGGYEWYGGIVDVSARGVRLRVRPGADIPDALKCHVLLEVSLPGASESTPPVRLNGDAVLLRRAFTTGDRVEEIALRFDEPLRVGDAFASILPTPRSSSAVQA